MPSTISFRPVFFSSFFLILATPLFGIPMEFEKSEKQQISAAARAAKARRATEEGGTEVENSALAKPGTELHVAEKREVAPNAETDNKRAEARLVDSLPSTLSASAIFQEEPQIPFRKKSPTVV